MTLIEQLRGCATAWVPGQTGHDVMVAAANRIAELEAALRLAQLALRDSHEAAVRQGVSVWWEVFEKQMRDAHDEVTKVLVPLPDRRGEGGRMASCSGCQFQ